MSAFPLILHLSQPLPKNLQRVLAVTPEALLPSVLPPCESWGPHAIRNIAKSEVNQEPNRGFEVKLDVREFAPEDLSVKVVDGFLIVEANHEERQDEHGWVKRNFSRRYALHEGCNINGVESHLSPDGILTVTAPPATHVVSQRIVPIIQTGPVRSKTEKQEGKGEPIDRIEPTVDTY